MLTILLLVFFASLLWLCWRSLWVHRTPGDGCPPGPTFKLPIIGQALWLGKNPTVGLRELRKKFGDIITLEVGPKKGYYVNELSAMEDLMNRDEFAGRIDIDTMINEDVTVKIRGWYPCPGLVSSYGNVWKEQRRFTLRHLRDFGFGKASLQDVIMEEFQDLADDIRKRIKNGEEEMEVNLLFNSMTLNVLWRIVNGKGIDRNDPKQKKIFEKLEVLLTSFGVNNVFLMLGLLYIPKCLRNYDPSVKFMRKLFDELFEVFDEEREEHEKTYDEEQMRDFIDVYIKECRQANMEGNKDSSFYGEQGRANFRNVLFDLFMTGSETTATSMVVTVLYCLLHPSITKKLQDEIDKVVGRERLPCVDDREKLPYVEAFISEIQRHGSLAPLAVPHAATRDVEALGYKFAKNETINTNLYEVMHDPANFPDPEKFDPERFLDPDTGMYRPHRAYVAFGVGKRECLGKSLAKLELFLFTSALVHKFNFEPASTGLPGLDDFVTGIIRSPKKFKAKFIPRED